MMDVRLDVIEHSYKNFPNSHRLVRVASTLLNAVSLETEDGRTEKLMVEAFKLVVKLCYDE